MAEHERKGAAGLANPGEQSEPVFGAAASARRCHNPATSTPSPLARDRWHKRQRKFRTLARKSRLPIGDTADYQSALTITPTDNRLYRRMVFCAKCPCMLRLP